MRKIFMDLSWFGEEGAAAAAPAAGTETGGSAETAVNAGTAPVQVGETVGGMKVTSPRVAAAMEKQMQRHPELRKVYGRAGAEGPAQTTAGQAQQVDAQAAQQQAEAPAEANDIQSRWEQLKKGEFAAQYGQDVRNAVQERFKNQTDLQGEMDKLEPALKVLRERAGVESNDDLIAQIMDDDSIYEEAANEAGMTVEAYKNYLKFKEEHDQHVRQLEEQQQREAIGQHYMKLTQQAEALKQQFPDFDLDRELQNERFLQLTSPAVNVSVEDAYFAIHHHELGPQMMAYGMQRAKSQMAQNIMANGARPREGGLSSGQAAAKMDINFKSLSRAERNKAYARVHAGGKSRDY